MIRRLAQDDSGAVAVLFAIVFLVVVGFSALAVDVGYWYTAKRQLQSAADAAALAGCAKLAEDADVATIENEVAVFAGKNFTNPLELASSRVESTEIGTDYVKVTAATDARVFLSHWLLNRGTTLIRAQAVAKIDYLAGGRGPVPWGLAVLDVEEMAGTLGGESRALSGADGYWETTFSSGRSGMLDLTAANSRGYEEAFEDLIGVGGLPATGRIAQIDVDQSTLTSGVDSAVQVTVQLVSALVDGGTVTVQIGGKSTPVALSPVTDTLYRGTVAVGTTPDSYATLDCEVVVTEDPAKQTAGFRLLLRRASYILLDVDVHPVAVQPTAAVTVRVKTLDFEYGVPYELKVAGGASEYGNFQALAIGVLDHSECGYTTYGSGSGAGGSTYRDNIVGNEDLVVHLLDIVDTEPGNMTGPTAQGIDARLTPPLMTLDQWEAAGRPETKQICVVPIVELIEPVQGKSRVQVVSFATFFLESVLSGNDTVQGRFVEWTAPGWYVTSTPPPSGLVVTAVHLTDEHLDF